MEMARRLASREVRFVRFLEGLVRRGDRAALAALRRGLGKPPGTVPEMFPLVVPWVPDEAGRRGEAAYYLVASLFALWHQGGRPPVSAPGGMGWSFAELARKTARDSTERRFVALLTSPGADLPAHLRQAISLLRSHEVPVEWVWLHRDVRRWDDHERPVQRRWAKDFWGGQFADQQPEHAAG